MENSVRSFRDLEAWQSSMDLAVEVHAIANALPSTHRFELASQLRRSATSIPSNVAEGHAQHHDPVFLRHVLIALGSLAELQTQLELSVRLKLVERSTLKSIDAQAAQTGRLLHGIRRRLRDSIAGKKAAGAVSARREAAVSKVASTFPTSSKP